jgi:hypothetical protein
MNLRSACLPLAQFGILVFQRRCELPDLLLEDLRLFSDQGSSRFMPCKGEQPLPLTGSRGG